MKYLGILFSFALFACIRPHVEAPKHQRPVGFWENRRAVVQVQHTYNIDKDKDGNLLVNAQGQEMVETHVDFGTGGVIDVSGLVITNDHVVRPKEILPGQFAAPPYNKDLYEICTVSNAGIKDCSQAKVVAEDPLHDLAYVYTNKHLPRAIQFADDSQLQPGDAIYLWGNVHVLLPLSPFFGYYEGTIDSPYYISEEDNQIQIPKEILPLMLADINVSHGTSGAPIFNEEGKCIGMTISFLPGEILGSRSLPFVIPLSTINKFRQAHPWPKKTGKKNKN